MYSPEANIVIYQGDVLDLLPTIPDNSIQLIVTSPPYNLGKEYENKVHINDYLAQQEIIINQCINKLKTGGSICWQVGNYVSNGEIIPLDILLFPIFSKNGLQLRNRIVWTFGHGLHASKRFSGRYEVILWFTKGENYLFNLDAVRIPQKYPNKKYFKGPKKGQLSGNPLGKNPTDVWDIPNVKANHIEKTIHPCQFPVELIERLVLSLTDPGDWVFDPFIGVGTTAIAALMHGRRAVGAEIIPEYIEIAKERLELANKGRLKIRPIDRPVYNPKDKNEFIMPKVVNLQVNEQPRLCESAKTYNAKGKGK